VAIRMAVGLVMAAVAIVLIVTKVVDPNSLQDFVGKNRPDVETVVDINAMKQNPAYFWLTITLVSFVVAGLREELWRSGFLAGLRTIFPGAFGSRRGEVLAVFLIAVIFGAAHINMGVLAVAMTGVLGIFLGLIMMFHRSIWPAVLAHGFFDATSMALLPWVMDYIKKAQ
jgi:membrane protease YdiL (CAAX protease family)